MGKVILKCETITPMFCYGADGKIPELRAPSIKGAMRFWWRALYPNLDLAKLKNQETEIFGGSDENGSNAKKSSFSIQVKSILFNMKKANPLPHKGASNKDAISAQTKLEIIIRGNKNLEKIKSLFEFIAIVGGIGGRSRRGFGSFKINSINDDSYNIELSNKNILDLIKKINQEFEFKEFNRNYPYLQKIEIGKAYNNYNNLLKVIGESSHENNSDYTGFAKGRNRYASPIYVTIYKQENKFYPIISTLNRTINDIDGAENEKNNFIKDILEGK